MECLDGGVHWRLSGLPQAVLCPPSRPLLVMQSTVQVGGGIYSPRVTVFRDSEDTGYAFRAQASSRLQANVIVGVYPIRGVNLMLMWLVPLRRIGLPLSCCYCSFIPISFLVQPYTLAIVGVAADIRPELTPDNRALLKDEDVLRLYRKVQTALAIALAHGHDAVILGALGCGAYRNPPGHVAEIFGYVLDEYAGLFTEVIFAIIDDHNARRAHNPDGNFRPFFQVLNGRVLVPHASSAPVPFAARAGRTLCAYGGACDGSHGAEPPEIDDVPMCRSATALGGCGDTGRTHRLLLRHDITERVDHVIGIPSLSREKQHALL
jgi:hypothetical protein